MLVSPVFVLCSQNQSVGPQENAGPTLLISWMVGSAAGIYVRFDERHGLRSSITFLVTPITRTTVHVSRDLCPDLMALLIL